MDDAANGWMLGEEEEEEEEEGAELARQLSLSQTPAYPHARNS